MQNISLSICYVKGTNNLHSLPASFHRHARRMFSSTKFVSLEHLNLDSLPVDVEEDYMELTILNALRNVLGVESHSFEVSKNILEMLYLPLPSVVDLILKQFYMDICINYNLDLDDRFNYLRKTKANAEGIKLREKINIDNILQRFFGTETPTKWKKFPYRSMVVLFLKNSTIETKELLLQIKKSFLANHFDVVFNLRPNMHRTDPRFLELVNTTGFSFSCDGQGNIDELRTDLITKIKSYIGTHCTRNKHVMWSNDEKASLKAGRIMYLEIKGVEKGVWTFLNDRSYF